MSMFPLILISQINKMQILNDPYFLRQIPCPSRHELYMALVYPQNLALILIHCKITNTSKIKIKLKGVKKMIIANVTKVTNVHLFNYPPNPLSLSRVSQFHSPLQMLPSSQATLDFMIFFYFFQKN